MALAHTLGDPIPPDTDHAVSVSLPLWKDNVGYEEGEERVTSRMQTGYPRFFINKKIAAFGELLVRKHGSPDQMAMLVPSHASAQRCCAFIASQALTTTPSPSVSILDFTPLPKAATEVAARFLRFSAVLHPSSAHPLAKSFWQHTGEGVSSRRAEYCRAVYERGGYGEIAAPRACRGPRRYQKDSVDTGKPIRDSVLDISNGIPADTNGDVNGHSDTVAAAQARFVEERYGRNLDIELAEQAKTALRRRIASALSPDEDETNEATAHDPVSPDDVFLYPGGMNAIFTTHRVLMSALHSDRRSICFGFPYIDTLKVLEKFGPGALFYGHGSATELDDLERRLRSGERYLALFCEFPSNPMLRTPDVRRIRALADEFDMAVVVDETVGNFANVSVLRHVDVLVSSLTKIFSGDSNVMGGTAVLNAASPRASRLRAAFNAAAAGDGADDAGTDAALWPEDAVFLERNSRDFVSRSARINANAETLVALLSKRPDVVTGVHYPSISPSRPHFDACRRRNGGYGGLVSATFCDANAAARFFDALHVHKGPSLGTNFTLASPFVLLAHYGELDWARGFGVPVELVRFSVGLESEDVLKSVVAAAFDAV